MSLPLLHSPGDVTRWLLIAMGGGSDPTALPLGAWPIYAGSEPSNPDEVLTVYDTTPRNDARIMHSGERVQHYGIQVRVRALDHATGHVKATALRTMMDENAYANAVTIAGTTYGVECFAECNLLILGRETGKTRRHLFTINAMVALQRLT
jgi:nitrate reductase gamma subunit